MKDRKGITIANAFQKILKESNRKPNKIWVDKRSEFCNNSVKNCLKYNDIETYLLLLKDLSELTKISKYMTSISKNVYIDKLDDTVKKYNNTYHRKIKMKPVDVKDNIYIDSMELHSSKEVNDKDPKSKVGDHVRISKYKNLCAKGYTPNWSEEVFVIKKVKNTVQWTYVINDLNSYQIICY